jgi:hypothetical protein
VINESFNQDIPVLVSDVVAAVPGGLIQNQKTRLKLPERDSDVPAGAFKKIWENPAALERLGSEANRLTADSNLGAQARGFLQVFQTVLQLRLTPSPSATSN